MKLDRKTGSILALAALAAASLATAAMADRPANGEGPMPMLMDRFDEMDADKDGKVTEAEIVAFRAARFAAMDTNADGVLDQAELEAFRLTEMQARAAADAERMIERFDKGGDGTLIVEELPRLPGEGRIFARLDSDEDGAVSKAELADAAERFAERSKGKDHRHEERRLRDGGTGWWWDMRAAD